MKSSRGDRLGIEKYSAKMGTGRGGSGKSAPQNTAVGSGSRPVKSKFRIDSTAPANAQMIRPKNVIGS